MGEALRDLRAKISVETDIALSAVALARGIDKTEIVREILHRWASEQMLIAKLIQKKMRAEGMDGNQ